MSRLPSVEHCGARHAKLAASDRGTAGSGWISPFTIKAPVLLAESSGLLTGKDPHRQRPCSVPPAWPPQRRQSAHGGRRDFVECCVGGCFTVRQRDRGLEENHFFGDFSEKHAGYFFSFFFFPPRRHHAARQTRSTAMKNPVYWAVLGGMAILLMEQGK